MMNIFLVRHAQSLGNLSNIKQGINDYDLSEEGIQQAQLLELGVTLDCIFSSPYKRAITTAKIIANNHNINESNIIQDERLREREVFNEKQNYELTKENRATINPYLLRYSAEITYGDGESFMDIHNRLHEFLYENIYTNNHLENIMIVSHAAAINHLIYLLLFGKTNNANEHYDFITKFNHIKNLGITNIINKDGKFLMNYFNK